MTDEDNLIQTGLRLFGAISYLVLTLIAFVANLLLLIVMYRGRKELLKFPFFTIALNMLIGDMLNLIFVMMVVAVPTTFAGQSIYSGCNKTFYTQG
uniref:G-protein coupled receptors family 1 profile domain-containing protein n=1 Tax=Acrobeloides nanus TaxID=290746 RepID=A0A914DSM9_9BILA